MIRRDLEAAAAHAYDLTVVGGGIYGVAVAFEAARRGLRALLLERDDFGAHTSWNSLRIVHGGLRYLQSLDLDRFYESIRERRWWLETFPDLVKPLPCLMPLHGRGLRRRSVLRLALAVNRALAGSQRGPLPDDGVLSVEETVSLCPALDREQIEGGALWHDAAMPDSQLLLFELLRWASSCGATALNYVRVTRLVTAEGRVTAVEAEDVPSGTPLRFTTASLVNCAGPWCREVAARFDRDHPSLFHSSLAFNLLLDQAPPSRAALAVSRPSGPTYFVTPWRGLTLAGTYHAPWHDGVEDRTPAPELVEGFLSELNAALPALNVSIDRVLQVHSGLLPARAAGSATLAKRPRLLDHGRHGGANGLWSVSGVKYTTARSVAERCVRGLLARGAPTSCSPSPVPRPAPFTTPGAEDFEALLDRAPLRARTLCERLCAEASVMRLDDLLRRRTDWGVEPQRRLRLADRLSELLGVSGDGWLDTQRTTERTERLP